MDQQKKQVRPQIAPHSSDGEEYDVAAVVQPGCISFQPREHGRQQADETEKPLFFDGESSIKEQDRNKEKSFPKTTDNDQCFKVNVAPVSDGILSPPKPQVMSPAIDIAKPCKHIINFATLLPLCRLPVKGDLLAYRFMEPSSSKHPQLSSPQVGEVSSFDCKTLHITLLPVLDHVFVSDENSHGAIVQPNASRNKEDGSLEIEFLSLVDVRLVKAHGSEEEKAYQDDHARKDKWEEALVKGSCNEPNASTGEQNNNWSEWIPNKSAAAMSCSLNQSNAPFAGRGRGRGRRAPNRCMSNRIPNMSTVNWNSNRNNAAWNPNMSINARFTAFEDNVMADNVMPPWQYGAPPGLPIPWEHHQSNNFLPSGKFSGRGKQ